MPRLPIVVLCSLVLSCAPRGQILLVPQAAAVGTPETIYVTTTRAVDPATGT